MVEIEHFSLSYPMGDTVLKDLSFTIKDGECVLLTGESGSGKSSIINSINGLSTRYDGCEYSGTIKINGKDTRDLELYEISMLVSSVFQNPKTHFFNIDTTLELLFFLENIGVSKKEMEERLEDMLQIFPISHLLDRDIFQLSGGEKQILCVASTYISGAKFVVMDEPSSNLDEKYTEILKCMIKVLKSKGISILIAEHRIYYLMELVDRVFIMKDGQICQEEDIEEFISIDNHTLSSMGIRSKEKEVLAVKEKTNEGELKINQLSYHFEGSEHGIDIKDLSLKKGKVYGIIGKNGCGKSTFVRSFIGLERKSKDEIYMDGKRLSKKDRLKLAGLVMQDVNHQIFTDSVLKELSLGMREFEQNRLDEILDALNLSAFKERHPMSLSGGQKQRVVIASVLLKNSTLICFDEPTSGMDYLNMVRISKLIKSCLDQDKIILIISHDIEFLNRTADDIIDIENYSYHLS